MKSENLGGPESKKPTLWFAVLFTLTFSNLFPSASSADTLDDVKKLCEPILNHAVANSYQSYITNKTESSYYRWACQFNFSSEQEAQEQGFNVGVVIDGIPLQAIFSNSQSKRSEARSQYCKITSGNNSQDSSQSMLEKQNNSFALYQFNECVQNNIVQLDKKDFICSIQETGDEDRLMLNTVLRKSTVYPDPTVASAVITNGRFLIDDFNTATDGGVIKPLTGSDVPFANSIKAGDTITIGSRYYSLVLQSSIASTAVNISLANGMSCEAKRESGIKVDMAATIYPSGQKIVNKSLKSTLNAVGGCGDNYDYEHKACLPPGAKIPQANITIISQNCGSFVGAAQLSSDEKCVTVPYHIQGCGFEGPWKSCKGRGWVDAVVDISYKGVEGSTVDLPRAEFSMMNSNGFITKSFDYRQLNILPSDIAVGKWNYIVSIKATKNGNTQTIDLTNAAPSVAGFNSSVNDGVVIVSAPGVPPPAAGNANPTTVKFIAKSIEQARQSRIEVLTLPANVSVFKNNDIELKTQNIQKDKLKLSNSIAQ